MIMFTAGSRVRFITLHFGPGLFAFSAHKAHLNFAPTPAALKPFRKELEKHKTTRNMLQISYNEPLPEELIRKIAELRLRQVGERESDAFW
jgi:uncharacterized protein YdhG (YjbR/CyaY superfamily)